MRKALQAEQSKAEILIKIQTVEEECADLEDEVEELRRRIFRMLEEEKEKEQELKIEHENEVN